jgi:hypothetical protein
VHHKRAGDMKINYYLNICSKRVLTKRTEVRIIKIQTVVRWRFYIMRSYYSKRVLHRRAAVITALIIGLALVLIVGINTVTVRADVSQNYVFESIQVKADDTLWSIGENYCPEDMELNEYIDIVRETNGISTDHIVVGNYLMIPVYDK